METARTLGDGMENISPQKVERKSNEKIIGEKLVETEKLRKISTTESVKLKNTNHNLPIPGLHTIYRAPTKRSISSVKSTSKLILLNPKLIKTVNKPEHKKTTPPRFVPFEPYPGCTSFLERPKSGFKMKRPSKNNLDINILVSQLKTSDNAPAEESEIKKIKEERDTLKRQLKIQVQVNSELKNLLIAAVGEDDLHTKVNILTEDKIELARAYNVSSQTEQIEFLAGQCEVWRSKFLATRIIIEELAQYKTALSEKNVILCDSNKNMLDLISQIRDMIKEILKNLKFLANLKTISLNSADVITLTSECLNITEQLVLHSTGIGIPKNARELTLNAKNILTEVEKSALKALDQLKPYLSNPDENYKAIVRQASRKLSVTSDKRESSSNN